MLQSNSKQALQISLNVGKKSALYLSILLAFSAHAAETSATSAAPKATKTADNVLVLEPTVVRGVRQRLYNAGMLKDVIEKTEVISSDTIEKTNSVNLTEAIAESPGVRVNNECSMCGVKRVMLNGLRGEHTTVLIDGIPMHTMLSGFYGLDAASTAGLQSIEIARGAGASLTAPEAIGGTLNMVTKTAYKNGAELDISAGEDGYKKAAIVGTLVANDDSTRITAIGQFDERDQYDGDGNGVSENPNMENQVLTLKVSQDIGTKDNVDLRASKVKSEVFGGPVGSDIKQVRADYKKDDSESAQLFEGGDVRNRFIGKSWETAEWIETDRTELSMNWLHDISENWNINLIAANVDHRQDSFYEGFDYDTKNTMQYYDLHTNIHAIPSHHIILGLNTRLEENRSTTSADDDSNYISDSFDYDSKGLYVQDTWTVNDKLEVSGALRFDEIEADFIDPKKPGVEIDEKLVSPRLDMRYAHNDNWTSRFSAGRGYRAPLSFFESDHGILDSGLGFDIQVDELERSASYNYALSYAGDKLKATGSIAHTTIDNLAALEEVEINGKTIPSLQQSDEKATSLMYDISASYQLTNNLLLSAMFESINYDDDFKKSFGVAPIEQRVNLTADWAKDNWDIYTSLSYIGSRDLNEFGAESAAAFDAAGAFPKDRNADAYWVMDVKVSNELSDNVTLYLGVNNLFDYTQVKDMQTPLFYADGGYDVADIYGPLRGREAYAGVKLSY